MTAVGKPELIKHEAALHSLVTSAPSPCPPPMEWRCLCGWTRAVNGATDRAAAELDTERHVRGLAS